MAETLTDPRRDLEAIRGLMERARRFRHLPPQAPLLAGLLALGGAGLTHARLSQETGADSLGQLGLTWAGIFLVSLGAQVGLGYREARKEGGLYWSPLAVEILHSLWPPLLVAVAFTVVMVRQGVPDLIAPLWILCYGVGGVTAGAYARPAVRVLGVAFLLAGLVDLIFPFPPGVALGATFGVGHLVYGIVLILRPSRG